MMKITFFVRAEKQCAFRHRWLHNGGDTDMWSATGGMRFAFPPYFCLLAPPASDL